MRFADRVYDPRREERRKRARVELPEDVRPDQLDPEVRRDLRSLSRETAEAVARHLVMTGRLIDEDPERALAHARAASALGGRVAAVREAAGLAAYAAGEWQEALGELRTYRRISGSPEHLPVVADCERALGRPERALAVGEDPDVVRLDQAVRVELALVLAGARRDMGQKDAAVVQLQGPARATTARRPWAARLWYGYADALLDAGRSAEAQEWFARVVEVDGEGATDADERLLELQGWRLDDEGEPESGAAASVGSGAAGSGGSAEDDGTAAGAEPEAELDLAELVRDVRPLSPPVTAPAQEPQRHEPDPTSTPGAAPAGAPAAGQPQESEAPAPASSPRAVPSVSFRAAPDDGVDDEGPEEL